jgi:hypothetical protein
MMTRKPLAQRSDQGNQKPLKRTLHREDATMQENQDPEVPNIEEDLAESEEPGNGPVEDSEPAGTNSTPEESDDDEGWDNPEVRIFTTEGPIQLYQITQHFATRLNKMFPLGNNGYRKLDSNAFQTALEDLRRAFWHHPVETIRYDYARIVMELPPMGSVFDPDGSYTLPNGLKVTRPIREKVLALKNKYRQLQDEQREEKQKLRQHLKEIADMKSHYTDSEKDIAPKTEAVNGSSTQH